MDAKTKRFQTILLIILAVGLAVGLMIFSGVIKTKPKGNNANTLAATGNVVMWGPISTLTLSTFVADFNNENKNSTLQYVGFTEEDYDEQLLEAFARGEAPDLIILPHTLISRYSDKLIPLNEEVFPARSFRDLYSQGAEIFRLQIGTIGLPVAVDPLVMYYNRDIIESAGIVNPPSFWNEDFLPFVQSISKIDQDGLEILVSGAPLGETENIKNALPIFSALAMQLGSMMTIQEQGDFESVLNEASLVANAPASSALEYFVNFSNPSSDVYSWNKTMPEARDVFARGESAVYFGFASELLEIQRKNPNLNFDVVKIPQIKELNRSLTYGNFYALAVPKTSKNTAGAFSIAGALSSGNASFSFLSTTGLQPVRKDLLANQATNLYQKVFLESAIIARAWVTPNPKILSNIIHDAVSAVTSGRSRPDQAIRDMSQKIDEAF